MSEHIVTYEQVIKKCVKKTITLKLYPCPFCGGEAEFRVGGNYNRKLDRRMGFGVRCKECKAITAIREGIDAQLKAAEIWNKRINE